MGVTPHVHYNEDEVAHVLEGEFEFQVDKQTHKLTQGAVIHLPRNIPHGFRNVGTKPGKTFWAVVPGTNFEKFFEELGSLPTEQPPDMTKVTEIFAKHAIEILPAPET